MSQIRSKVYKLWPHEIYFKPQSNFLKNPAEVVSGDQMKSEDKNFLVKINFITSLYYSAYPLLLTDQHKLTDRISSAMVVHSIDATTARLLTGNSMKEFFLLYT